ncbi:MAG: TonB-dependent receptor [Bacteroidota bacterium]
MKRSFNLLTIFMVLLVAPTLLFGQRTISGQITDAETSEPLIGANVLIQGTAQGTATDFDGKYTLEVPDGATGLVISYTGYTEQNIELGASNVVDIQLSSGAILEEVVVIGYGTVKKDDATGAIQTVDSDKFNKGAISSPQELLAGKMAGVVISTPGAPGEKPNIRIRGGSSLSASNDPLIVVDGIPLEDGDIKGGRNFLNAINPNDIETFTVLKDASATAIYGSRASNGVILITTKKGKLGKKLSVDYNGNISFSTPANTMDVMNADQYRDLVNERFEDGNPARDLLGTANTDWQDEIFQTAFGHEHNLSFSGGVGIVPYRLSVGFADREGIVMTDAFQRTTASLNLSPGFLDNRLQVNFGIKSSFTNNTFGDKAAVGEAVRFDPTQPVRDPNSPYGGFFTWTQANGDPNPVAATNPVARLMLTDDQSNISRFITTASVDYRFGFLPELRANLNLAYDFLKAEGSKTVPQNAAFAFDEANGGGLANTYEQEKRNELVEFYLNYAKDFGTSRFDIMGGYSWQRLFFDDTTFDSNTNGSEIAEGDESGELFLLSLFGRLNYSIQDKYLFTFTLRRDGTSRFSPDTRWGLFPAAAFAWKVFEDDKASTLNSLKLRLGYGVTGQQNVTGGYYTYQSRYLSSFDNARYQIGDEFITTLRPEGYDANIKWEETTTYNVGVDYSLFKDRVFGSLEYYIRQTDDLINFIPVPAGTNLTNFVNTNVGDLENRGVEFTINAIPYRNQDVEWSIGFNMAMNNNEITRLIATDDPTYLGVFTGGISGGVGNNIQIHSVGFPTNSFFVFEQVYDENGQPIEGVYVDRNGDGQVTPDDRYRLENPAADVTFGFTTGVNYKNFDFSLAGRAYLGNYIYNNNLSDQANYNRIFNTNSLSNVHPDIREIDFTVPQYFSDHFIEDASFLRVDHITLGYRIPSPFGQGSNLRLYATVQNPILITQYEGLDPEVFDGTNNGIDNNIYPRARTFLFGVNASF